MENKEIRTNQIKKKIKHKTSNYINKGLFHKKELLYFFLQHVVTI